MKRKVITKTFLMISSIIYILIEQIIFNNKQERHNKIVVSLINIPEKIAIDARENREQVVCDKTIRCIHLLALNG